MNRRIAEYAMSLTDALFAVEVKDGAVRPERSFGSAAHLRVGHQSRPGWTTPLPSDPSAEQGTVLVAPADVLGRKSTVANKYEPRTTAWYLRMSEIWRRKTCECDAAGRALANLAIMSVEGISDSAQMGQGFGGGQGDRGADRSAGSPVQWVLQPRGTARVRGPQHFRHSVRDGVRLSAHESAMGADANALKNLFPEGVARLWGSTPPVRERSEKVTALAGRKVGDEVLFYAEKKFVAKARIIGLFDNHALASAVWGRDESQKTWQHIMALGNVVEFEVPAEPVLRGLGVPVPSRSLTLVGAETRLGLWTWSILRYL